MFKTSLKVWKDNPLWALIAQFDMFGTSLDRGSDYVLYSLQSYVNVEEKAQLIDILQRLEIGRIDVIDKQMSDYLIGNLSTVVLHQQKQFKHAQPLSKKSREK